MRHILFKHEPRTLDQARAKLAVEELELEPEPYSVKSLAWQHIYSLESADYLLLVLKHPVLNSMSDTYEDSEGM